MCAALTVRAFKVCTVPAVVAAAMLAVVVSRACRAGEGGYKHLGAGSCGLSVCHNQSKPQAGRNVALDQYGKWLNPDLHSQAYKVLESPRGKAIAAKLGLAATSAKLCLDCHADNVPTAYRGPNFRLAEGVGCEACHGGSENWSKSHARRSATHADNVSRGMNPTESPTRRAEICLKCHLGAQDRFATHDIMAAGHPRLRFELFAFTGLQPAHFVVDNDYVRRKGKIPDVNYWVSGQFEAATRFLTLLQSAYFQPAGLTLEFAFYDCYSCHHSIDTPLRWTQQRAGAGVKPGTLRVQKQHLIMVQALAETVDSPESVKELGAQIGTLTRACQSDLAAARAAASKVSEWLRRHQDWTQRTFSRAEAVAIRRTLLRYAATDKASDFLVAEQVWLGVQSLSSGIGDTEPRKRAIDALFAVVDPATFDPERFAAVARSVQVQF